MSLHLSRDIIHHLLFHKNNKGSINMHIWEGKNLCDYSWDSITHLQYSKISWSHLDNARGVWNESNHSFCNRIENGPNICQVCIKVLYIHFPTCVILDFLKKLIIVIFNNDAILFISAYTLRGCTQWWWTYFHSAV